MGVLNAAKQPLVLSREDRRGAVFGFVVTKILKDMAGRDPWLIWSVKEFRGALAANLSHQGFALVHPTGNQFRNAFNGAYFDHLRALRKKKGKIAGLNVDRGPVSV